MHTIFSLCEAIGVTLLVLLVLSALTYKSGRDDPPWST